MDSSMFDFIEKVVYINLAKRTDRREHMEQMTSIFGDKVIRFEAIETKPGCIGCSKSHVAVLEMAISNNWKNVLILEDDVLWNHNEDAYDTFKSLTARPFDVILLGSTFPNYSKETFRINWTNGAFAYLVNNHYFQPLVDNFKESVALYEIQPYGWHHLDNWWNRLLTIHDCFLTAPNIIYHMDGYSDNDLKYIEWKPTDFVLTK